MSRLIVASNRVGDFKSGFQAGGLAVALCDVLRVRGGIWFGTEQQKSPGRLELFEAVPGVQVAEVPIEKEEYRSFYNDYANSLLWPICHNRIDLARFDDGSYRNYRKVNADLADAVAASLRGEDVVWVHDYHLIPLGEELRKRGAQNPIGFFLHIPFPPGDVFAAVPQHEALATSLGHYDLIGFQTQKDVASFLNYVQRHLAGRILNDGRIRLPTMEMTCASFPIGIDAAEFAKAAEEDDEDTLSAGIVGPAIDHIIGVDRLDYSKGLTQRFQAFAKFLETNPHRHQRVTYTQIAPPTRQGLRAYAHIRNELERLAGSINGRFGGLDWMPIHYIHRAFPRNSLARLFRRAKVGLVTPTQDGMNLVAKEYVAAQDPEDPGVLVLSRFAGAAEQLTGAIIINPYDEDDCARSIEAALNMPLAERRDRYRRMFRTISECDVYSWSRAFLRELEKAALRREDPLLEHRRRTAAAEEPPRVNKPAASRREMGGVLPG